MPALELNVDVRPCVANLIAKVDESVESNNGPYEGRDKYDYRDRGQIGLPFAEQHAGAHYHNAEYD